jgi:hypothetical protein
MGDKLVPVVIRLHPPLYEGLRAAVARDGESAGVIIRSLLRQELMRRGITEADIRRAEDASGLVRGISGNSGRPLERADR